MHTLVIGGSGKIGKFLGKNNKKIFLTYFTNKIPNGIKFNLLKDDISPILTKYNINKVVFLSAISDPNICFKKKKYTHLVNIKKTKMILNILIKKNIYFIFFSSEFIFSGSKGGYTENDVPKPNNQYGKQKLNIENFIIKKTKNFSIFRIAKTYSDDLEDDTLIVSYLKKIINGKSIFNVAHDQKFNPLYVADLNRIVSLFIKKNITGIYNVGGPEKLSRFDCYKKINDLLPNNVKKLIKLKKVKLKNFEYFDHRPLNVTMNTAKLDKIINFKKKTINQVTKSIIKKYKINEKKFNRG